jgi:hypothetical protein
LFIFWLGSEWWNCFPSTSPERDGDASFKRRLFEKPHLPLREKVRGNGVSLREKVRGNGVSLREKVRENGVSLREKVRGNDPRLLKINMAV